MKFSSSAAEPRGGTGARGHGNRGRSLRAKVQSGAELLCKSANVSGTPVDRLISWPVGQE